MRIAMNYPYALHPLAVQPRPDGTTEIRNQESGDHLSVSSTFARILLACDGQSTVDEIVQRLVHLHQISPDRIRADVTGVLQQLAEAGFLAFTSSPCASPIFSFPSPLDPPLRLVYLELTNLCNLRCLHCYNESGPNGALPEVDWQQIVAQLKRLGVLILVLTGGEPLMYPGLPILMETIKAQGMAFALFTNAFALTAERLAEMQSCRPEILCISLDGATAATHDYIRGRPCFDRIIKRVRQAVDAGFRVRLGAVLYRHNINEVADLLRLASELGVAELRMETFMAWGRGLGNMDLQVPFRKVRQIATTVTEAANQLVAEDRYLPRLHFDGIACLGSKCDTQDIVYPFCGVGREICLIQPNGDVIPCALLRDSHFVAGNVLEHSLEDIWENSPVFGALRRHELADIPRCRTCTHMSTCRGGCRAKAYLFHGDLCAPDDYMCYSLGVLPGKAT